MGRHPEYLAFVRRVAAMPPPEDESIPGLRRAERESLALLPRTPVGSVEDLDLDGVPGRLYRPEGVADGPVIVYFHGGGWVLGDVEGYDPILRQMVAASGTAFLSVDYRRAPEHPYPAAVDDAEKAVRWAVARFPQVGVGGDSAGGQIGASAVNRLYRDLPIVFQLLVYPALDLRHVPDPLPDDPDGMEFAPGGTNPAIASYIADSDPANPDMSPLLASDLTGLPPTLCVLAEFDRLMPQGEAYAARLRLAGVPTAVYPGTGLDHGWMAWFPFAQAPADALREVGALIAETMNRVSGRV